MGGLLLVILWLNAALGLAWLLSGPHVVRRDGGLVDMGLPMPKGSTGRWDDHPWTSTGSRMRRHVMTRRKAWGLAP